LCGGQRKKGLVDLQKNFWEFLITDEQQRPANGARMGKQHVFTSTLKFKGHTIFHSRFISRPLPSINNNQQSPKVAYLAVQNSIGDPPDPFFSTPQHTKEKVVWA